MKLGFGFFFHPFNGSLIAEGGLSNSLFSKYKLRTQKAPVLSDSSKTAIIIADYCSQLMTIQHRAAYMTTMIIIEKSVLATRK